MRLNIKNVMLMVVVLTITACNFTLNTPDDFFYLSNNFGLERNCLNLH
jgi:outer membrane lipopolysaccharide assembly protein LptE/RlpB